MSSLGLPGWDQEAQASSYVKSLSGERLKKLENLKLTWCRRSPVDIHFNRYTRFGWPKRKTGYLVDRPSSFYLLDYYLYIYFSIARKHKLRTERPSEKRDPWRYHSMEIYPKILRVFGMSSPTSRPCFEDSHYQVPGIYYT